jgi:predicted dehydrogenase
MDVPEPTGRPGWVVVETRCSLISAGTERTKIETGSKNFVQKARARPDLVRKVIDETRVQGVRATASTVRDRLNSQSPLGYSCSGVVMSVGAGVEGVRPGDNAACGGSGWANHAEVVCVPKHLVVALPEGVDFETGAYATVASIALHGVRQAGAEVGDVVGVIGLGLIGQLAVRLLLAAGCRVVGIDVDPDAVRLAAESGATSINRDDSRLEERVRETTRGVGLDATLICAATRSGDPVAVAARLARDRGRLVVVGDVPIEADRALFYEKELELRLSRSYGPGRYDVDYEERGRDLPPGYIRWTEQRNIASFLDLAAAGRIDVHPLTTHRFAIDDAAEAYGVLTGAAERRPFGIVLEYATSLAGKAEPPRIGTAARLSKGAVRVGFIGAGNFMRATLLPAFADAGAQLVAVASTAGLTAADAARRFGIERAVEPEAVVAADDVDAVVVGTRHSSHAAYVASALRAGKAVFVEKPLALSNEELDDVEAALLESSGILMVGFNRRFAPLAGRLRGELAGISDTSVLVRVNAGPLPEDHWLHDPIDGGGRLLGEGCHFVDLVAHLSSSRIASVQAFGVPQHERPLECTDTFVLGLSLANGGIGSIVYSGGGDSRLPKERVEAFGGGLAAVLDDFRRLELYRGGRREIVKGAQDKGHRSEIRAFVASVRGEAEPVDVTSYLNSSRAAVVLAEALRTNDVMVVP